MAEARQWATVAQELSVYSLDVLEPGMSGTDAPIVPSYLSRYNLHIASAKGAITRLPVYFGMPAVDHDAVNPFANRPISFGLDLGLIQEYAEVQGFCNDYETDTTFLDMTDLQEISRTAGIGSTSGFDNANFQNSFKSLNAVVLHMGAGHNQGAVNDAWNHKGIVLSFTYARDGGELFWSYTLRVGTLVWPTKMNSVTYPPHVFPPDSTPG